MVTGDMTYTAFQDFKSQIMAITGLEKDALHIYVGIGVFLLTSFVLKYSRTFSRHRWWLAVLIVVMVACMGEAWDRYESLHLAGVWDKHASLHDLLNTCFFPALLAACQRLGLFKRDVTQF